MRADEVIPVVLFAHARPHHLRRVLDCLRVNRVPLIYAFADGARGREEEKAVAETRAALRAIDWAAVRVEERPSNFGLGRNVLAGITAVVRLHPALLVWEDDLICVPGTYDWLCSGLKHYADDQRVMSVTGWTHPRITPGDITNQPYFDARAECWVWGTYARCWAGMDVSAPEKVAALAARGFAPDSYGSDLPAMARAESRKNIWAVRWLYHHLAAGGLCLRPPWSMVEHIGFDASATNAGAAAGWANPPLRAAPPIPQSWPAVEEHPLCRELWQRANQPARRSLGSFAKRIVRKVVPARISDPVVRRFFRVRWSGDYRNWAEARAQSSGYDSPQIVERVTEAARSVRDGRATYERDGMAFQTPSPPWPFLPVLQAAGNAGGTLTVLDVGGSLGSHYFPHRDALRRTNQLDWRVVEQPRVVEVGTREFQSAELRFFASMQQATDAGRADVLLLGSVLPYVEDPMRMLEALLAYRIRTIVIEKTGFTIAPGTTRLTIQHVPRSLYSASYPCWFLDRPRVVACLAQHGYSLVSDSPDDVDVGQGLEFRSLHFTLPA